MRAGELHMRIHKVLLGRRKELNMLLETQGKGHNVAAVLGERFYLVLAMHRDAAAMAMERGYNAITAMDT